MPCRRLRWTQRSGVWSKTSAGLRWTSVRSLAGAQSCARAARRWPMHMPSELDPNLIVCLNGEFVPLREARVGILTHALHYGTGVFEGIRAYWSDAEHQLFLLRPVEHFRRWKQN